MKIVKSLVGKVQEVSGRSTSAKMLWFVAMAYVFLWVPDIDLIFIGVLHHRSIITHSILPAVLLLLLGRRAGAAPLAGAMIGLAVHLSCDLLSPAVGFGQIWLPAPIKAPIGPLTYPWLFANALSAFWIARWLAMKAFNVWAGYSVMLVVSVITALSYGVFNENSLLSSAVTLIVFSLSLIGAKKTIERDPVASKKMKATSEAVATIRKGAISGLDSFSETMNSASNAIENYTEDMLLRNKFSVQQSALSTIYDLAQDLVEYDQRTAAMTDSELAIYKEIKENWGADHDAHVEGFKGLDDDLLKLADIDVLPRQFDELKALQTTHQSFMRGLKKNLLADADIQAKFSKLMLESDAQERLEQVLGCWDAAAYSS
jgi:hypothetical protein